MLQAVGTRIGWRDLPAEVRQRIERIIGGPVVKAVSQSGGFSPGTADRVATADGRRAFVKAVSPAINERSAELARQEVAITSALPGHIPAPRVLGSFDDGDWVVLVLEDIEGTQPRTPWEERDIDAAVTALTELAEALTPAPLTVPPVTDELVEGFAGWQRLADDPPADLDPWAAANLPALIAASERGLAALSDGDTLAHCDIRADNILVRPDGRLVIVDWPWGATAPVWFDRVLLALNITVYGGDPERVIADLDRRTVTDLFAGFAGFFRDISRLPPPPGLPSVRAFQRWQADELLPWIRREL
ncbi:aminoglycoside phosphotransferase family protein [Actinoplanes sp. LDG1-06]|uniref:Aminoglycoside phosphotransferase family protein n=1 Tax=Paractinoplanes ovalisporus TaxID=2810368 RepID=A0ABS2AFU6_9ACTN|nr:aminoglycoside phosphotransferase family protein [Actinoplanes ovalisporus]MBM2618686.1 aminoglycoside phosphotransferase family protein [Actinoplanes ovalisporus]